jgi:carboxyl-terminal processing protease
MYHLIDKYTIQMKPSCAVHTNRNKQKVPHMIASLPLKNKFIQMKNKLALSRLNSFFVLMMILVFIAPACKKDDDLELTQEEETPGEQADGSRDELTKDSIFLYAKQVYLWNDALPTYQEFNPRKYTQYSNELDNYNSELFDITQYKINPATGNPYEFISTGVLFPKYSYITDESSNNPSRSASLPIVSQVSLEGVGTDFGIALSAVGSTNSYQVYIRYVSPGSAAANNGLTRGDILTKVNERTLGSNFASDQNFINSAFDQSRITLVGRKSNGATFTRALTKMTYNSSPVYKDTVVTVGGKKIGYLAFARFSNLSNAQGPLNSAFTEFANNGVTNLVVDLRYNGGGYVSTAEEMANLIAPSSVNGKVMFTEYFNPTMQNGQATILRNQPLKDANGRLQYSNGRLVTYYDVDYSVAENTYEFQKKGSLTGVTNVVFIVTDNTASASELVINVLKPYINVKLVGSTSYGKPVGFFPITIDRYDVYYSMFESRNS